MAHNILENKHKPQLDSLRAIAVILVIISHWFSKDHFFNRYTSNGSLGVTLFFVLSGFLITGILLDYKNKIQEGSSMGNAYKTFYARRSLRIFPVYYVLLFVLLAFNTADIQKSFWWHFLYGSNFYFWQMGHFAGSLSHFWSLAVEEQFYLVWPAIILFTPRLKLPAVFLVGILVAIIFRFLITDLQNDIGRILMPGSLDSFCIGGLLAFARKTQDRTYQYYLSKRNVFFALSLILFAGVHTTYFKALSLSLQTGIYFFIISLVFAVCIDKAADGIKFKLVKVFLENKLLVYIGKISYGIYLFHNFFPPFYGLKLPNSLVGFSFYIEKGLRFCIVLLIASISWFFLEKPLLNYKARFQVK